MAQHGNYTVEKVTFPSHGETLVGDLYRPKGDGPFPVVVTLGPYSFEKEQAPTQYSTRLADEGFVSLAFDPRTVGESGGEPRRLENPVMKNEDVVSALDYLVRRSDVDASRVFALGICQGGPELLDVASYDDRITAVACVTGYFRDADADLFPVTAGVAANPFDETSLPPRERLEALLSERLQRAREAKELYETTGEVIYQPLVSPDLADPTVGSRAGLPGPAVWAWYGPWTLKGFENRYAIMSDLDHFGYSTVPGVAKLQKPAIVFHGDYCLSPISAKRHFESIATTDKKLVWDNDIFHSDYYDTPDVVDRTAGAAADWFRNHGA